MARLKNITIRRSELASPASSPEKMAKAAASEADEVVFDLEDGCAPSQKVAARATLIHALRTLDFKGKIRAFRVNSIQTKFFYRDLIEVVEAAGANVDAVLLPKADDAADVLFADRLLNQIEQNTGLEPGRIRLEVVIETPKAVLHAEPIAAASPRVSGLIFGVLDYSSAMGARGRLLDQYSYYHYPREKVLAAARAAGVDAIDSVTLQIHDSEKCEHDARISAEMGFDGKWAIHPDQAVIINRVFTPSREELVRAKEVLEMYNQADAEGGSGVFVYNNEMIDAASLHIERKKLAIAARMGLI